MRLELALDNAVEELNERDTFKDLGISFSRGEYTRRGKTLNWYLQHKVDSQPLGFSQHILMKRLQPVLQKILISHLAQHESTFAGAKLELRGPSLLTEAEWKKYAANPEMLAIRITKPKLGK